MSGTTTFNVTSAADLAADIALIDATGADAAANTAYTFNITANAALTLTSQLDAINLDSGSSLTINGNGATLDGGGKYNGLFVYAGTVAINDLAIDNALAIGGNGAGGGAGLGGGLFIASAGAVTLTGVSFADDEAKGGGANQSLFGGGGLDGGNGNFGGGGVGLSASGGGVQSDGRPGIIIGAASGGAGADGFAGGADGGGGGGVESFSEFGPVEGGGGGVGGTNATLENGSGGFGGGGGGGGIGGFGGGGGISSKGGFGGGGGGGSAASGFGGGAPATIFNRGGSGGLGAGGGVFVQQGGSLTYTGGSDSGGSVAGGAGTNGGGNGSAFGAGIFLQGNQKITLSATLTQPLTISDVIADQTGSGGTGSNAGAGSLLITGPGAVTLSAANTYTGGTSLTGGTLTLANAHAAGSGAINFVTGDTATLQIGLGDAPANTIAGFTPGETIDLSGVGTETTAVLSSGNLLTLSGGSSSVSLQLDPNASYAGESFKLTSDAAGGTDVGVLPTTFNVTSAADLAADIALIDATGADAAANTAYTFNITANAALTLTGQLDAINLDSGSSLTINGNGATLDGGGKYNGLFVYAGAVAINDMAIDNALAIGGNGAGGGAGLGGGLFIASAGAVTLTGVSFADDEAKGGGANQSLYGGGGLDGGNGNYGGGGVGLSASGGAVLGHGSPGIVIGAASGGAGDGGFAGGADGGGGGGVDGSGGYGPLEGGGGGVGGSNAAVIASGSGGFGGGGGGDSNGGFGGGGGYFSKGGFGGGSGGPYRASGFGGGAFSTTNNGGGSGGLGAGGGIFVQQGGSLTYTGGSDSGGTVAGGAGTNGGGNGSGFGAGIFLQGNQQITLSATLTQPLTISDVIADQTGSGGTGSNAGAGSLLITGPGAVTLSAANTYTGGTTLTGGTLTLANAQAAGRGAITFAGAATLGIAAGDAPANTIDGFTPGDTIDLAGVGAETTVSLASGNTLTISGTTPVTLQLDPTASFANDVFALATDGNGGTAVTVAPSVAPTISGAVANQATTLEAPIEPFSTIVVGDGNFGATDTLNIAIVGHGGTLTGTGLMQLSATTYTITGAASTVTTDLEGLRFTPAAGQGGTSNQTNLFISDSSTEYPIAVSIPQITVTDTDPAAAPTITPQSPAVVEAGQATTIALLTPGYAGDALAVTGTGNAGALSLGPANASGAVALIYTAPSTIAASGANAFTYTVTEDGVASSPQNAAVTLDTGPSLGALSTPTITLSSGSQSAGAGAGKVFSIGSGAVGLAGDTIISVTDSLGLGTFIASPPVGTMFQLGFTPGSADAPGTYQDAVTVQDELGGTATQMFDVTLAAVPTISGTVANQTTTSQAATPVFAGVTITDPNPGATDTLAITYTGPGTLAGSPLLAGSAGAYTLTGTAAAITAALDALSFTPVDGVPNTTVTTAFTLTDTSSALPSTPATDSTTSITDTDPPVAISAADGASTIATTDEQATNPFTSVSITDPNANQAETATVTLSAANGVLSDSLGGSVSGGVYTVSGSASMVAADLDALVFTPTAHEAAPGTVVATQVTASITDTAGKQAALLTTVNATAVNDKPVISGTVAGQSASANAALMPFATALVSDVDTGVADSLTITVTSGGTATDANGTLSGTGLSKNGAGAYTLAAAAPATLTAELRALTFTTSALPGTATFQLTATQTAGGSTVTASDSTTSVTVISAALNYIYGPAYGNAVIQGTPGPDDITAYGYYNTIYSNGGNDIINAGQGYAKVYAAGGNDVITLAGYYDTVTGSDGNDTISGSQGNSTITLGNGNDSLKMGGYYNVVTLGNGNDTLTGPQGNTQLTIGNGSDVVTLGGYYNVVNAGTSAGTDYLDLGVGNETLTGGDGNFVVLAGGYGDVVKLGNGNNDVFTTPSGVSNPSLPAGSTAPVEQGNANVTTGSGNDTILLSGYGNVVNAGGGMNFITGGTGNDTFFLPIAGAGIDTITGFTASNGDVLNLASALAAAGWNNNTSTLGSYLAVSQSGANAIIDILPGGSGPGVEIAQLNGVSNLTLSVLQHHAVL